MVKIASGFYSGTLVLFDQKAANADALLKHSTVGHFNRW